MLLRNMCLASLLLTVFTCCLLACNGFDGTPLTVCRRSAPIDKLYPKASEKNSSWVRNTCKTSISLRGGGNKSASTLGQRLLQNIIDIFIRMLHSIRHVFKRSQLSLGSSKGVTTRFSKLFGHVHPAFYEGSFKEACEISSRSNKFCLVFLSSDRGGKQNIADETICRSLSNPAVVEFIDRNFLIFSCGSSSPAGSMTARQLGVTSFPFLGIVRTLPKTFQKEIVGLHHCNPSPKPDDLTNWMSRILDNNAVFLDEDKKVLEHLKSEANLSRDRQKGYAEAIVSDKKDIKRREKEAVKEIQLAEKAKADFERRSEKSAKLGDEPDFRSADLAEIMLRLPNGKRIRRRFLTTDTVENIFDWADVLEVDIFRTELSRAASKAQEKSNSLRYPEDSNITLIDAGLVGRNLLFVQDRI